MKKTIYNIMIFALICTFMLSFLVTPAFADSL